MNIFGVPNQSRDRNPFKSSVAVYYLTQMGNSPVDRNKKHMYQMWGTDRLVTDYNSLEENKEVLQEIVNDSMNKKCDCKCNRNVIID
jgi:hypothetical protein